MYAPDAWPDLVEPHLQRPDNWTTEEEHELLTEDL